MSSKLFLSTALATVAIGVPYAAYKLRASQESLTSVPTVASKPSSENAEDQVSVENADAKNKGPCSLNLPSNYQDPKEDF